MKGHLGDRLREAIQAWGSIRAFSKEMERRGLPCSTYPTIHSYLNGQTDPRVSFVTAAAEVLGVGRYWLAFGEGEGEPSGDCVSCRVKERRAEEAIRVLEGR